MTWEEADIRKDNLAVCAEDTYRLFIPVKDVFLGEEPHAVHQTHLTIALLSTNIDAFTLACTHPHNTQYTHTHKAKQSTYRQGKKQKAHVRSCVDTVAKTVKNPPYTDKDALTPRLLYVDTCLLTFCYIKMISIHLCMCVYMCCLTLAIGRERSQKGSKTVEQKPQWLQVRELFSCPTNRSGRNVTRYNWDF